MPRPRLPFELGPYRSVKLPLDVDEAVTQLALEMMPEADRDNPNKKPNVAEAIRVLLMEAVSKRGGLSGLGNRLENSGYNAGMRQGLQEARAAIAGALTALWKEG